MLITFAAGRHRSGRAHLLEFEIRPFHFVLCPPQQNSPEAETLDSDGELMSSSKCRLKIQVAQKTAFKITYLEKKNLIIL